MTVEYVIEKVSSGIVQPTPKKNFPRLPQLYLEFFENKHKIKPEFVNQDYIPPEIPEGERSKPAPPATDIFKETASLHEDDDNSTVSEPKEAKSTYSTPSSTRSIKTASHKSGATRSSKQQLLNMLKNETPLPEKTPQPRITTPRVEKRLPTLKELEQQNGFRREKVVVDASRLEDKDEDKKRDILMKFDLLKRTYPKATLPERSIHEDIKVLERKYEETLKTLAIGNSVDNYKQYLTFLFMGIEWFCGKVLKMNMEGYVDHQCEQMHKYEKFLVQIGEKNYLPSGKRWPVELQLLIAVIVQTAFFVLMKSVFKNAGASILRTVNEAKMPAAAKTGSTDPASDGQAKTAYKMRGPTVSLEEIPTAT